MNSYPEYSVVAEHVGGSGASAEVAPPHDLPPPAAAKAADPYGDIYAAAAEAAVAECLNTPSPSTLPADTLDTAVAEEAWKAYKMRAPRATGTGVDWLARPAFMAGWRAGLRRAAAIDPPAAPQADSVLD